MNSRLSIKAIKFNDILLYKNDIGADDLKEFKSNMHHMYLEDDDSINAKLFYNDDKKQLEIFEWVEYKIELIQSDMNKPFDQSEFLKKGYFGNENFGTLFFKNYVGISSFRGNRIHVLSKKITDKQVNNIIEFINENITCIGFDFNQPVMSSIKRNTKKKTNQDYYMFLFIMNTLRTKNKSLNFFTNFKIIESDPYRVFITTSEFENINSSENINEDSIISIFENTNNLIYCANTNNKLAKKLSKNEQFYLPQSILNQRYDDSFDNPENRFIKFFITNSLMILEKFYVFFSTNRNNILNRPLIDETKNYIDKLKQILRFSYLNHVNDLILIPMNSTVLTRRAGYKKIFNFYLGLKSVPENIFSDKNLDEVVENKSIDVIYELFCFFSIVHVLAEIYNIEINNLKYIVEKKIHSQSLSKKNNNNTIIYDQKDKLPKIKLHYNKSYSYPMSYSKQFDPDISIEVLNSNDEIEEIFIFDAKFKVNLESSNKKFKDDDIAKMHSYKDAIKLSKGAYILYPGNLNKIFNETKDPVELEIGKVEEYLITLNNKNSIGALCLNAENSQNKEDLKHFIQQLITI
ncbi:DUF2357 domain-containing protein [Aliarcobacter cryaerophilus]|uniref:DUF2357 domain-containing protein n=1 Tax=Aliarcobacter cryaerophilus TaxID=28198 RepID=UPI0021B27550|nr:DUF2357 domain-containing protein [Aliarcobacter cryaerophilus]MCT7464888.1 DUF2357 domain-containing protein [Aliarcobacter cryaerophilus]